MNDYGRLFGFLLAAVLAGGALSSSPVLASSDAASQERWMQLFVGPEQQDSNSTTATTANPAGDPDRVAAPQLMLAQGGTGAGVMGMAEEKIEGEPEEDMGDMDLDQIAEMLANPFSYLWFGMVQNDTYWYDGDLLDTLGDDRKIMNTTMIQPVMSLQLTEESRLIFRPVIPINSFDTIDGIDIIDDEIEGPIINSDWNRETGLGDIVLWGAYSPQYTPPFVFGFGATVMMDTATEEWLGTGKWSAGPMVTAVNISDKWIVGAVAQHWWSFAGDNDRDDVNLTDFQPLVRYRLSPTTNIGIAPNIRYNWDGNGGNKLQLPIGGGISTVIKLGRVPVGIGAEFYYYAESNDDFGPEYQFRFFVTPVVPSPDWSRQPLFAH